MAAIQPAQEIHDVVVIGSGAGGGTVAHVLTALGVQVTLLEAGPMLDPYRDFKEHQWPYDVDHRGANVGGTRYTDPRSRSYFSTLSGGWELEGEPYTVGDGSEFQWFRSRIIGGRTNHYGRMSFRFSDYDFKPYDRDGLGVNWPISYEDIAPYYDKVDRLVGLFGSVEGLPNDPDGIFMPPPQPRCWELAIKRAADQLDITCIPSRLSILTKPLNGRPSCHYCGQCGRDCGTGSNFSTPSVLLPPARATGRLEIITGAMAREITVNARGLANGVSYVDTNTGSEEHVRAKAVVLAASACESARLLLNSKSSLFPEGLANSSGAVGRYLTDSTGTDVMGFIPSMRDGVPHNEDGTGGAHLYMPWWLDNTKLDFPRGYHIEIWGGRGMPGYGFMGGIQNYPGGGGYGKDLKQMYRSYYGATVGFSGRGEMIPNKNSYCEIDPEVVDRWGIPVLRFHFAWSDHEVRQVRHMQETFREIIEVMGGEPLGPMPGPDEEYGIAAGGVIIHELGVTRMGSLPDTSVLNSRCQAHDVKNLFVADAGPFVSQPNKNPTWTILALAMRTCDYIAELANRGELA